jgi:ABC-type sugar transport system ATPase subunit
MKIELRNISKSFHKGSHVIENLHLKIEEGEMIALLGPSGCGKSTTMLMIAGIYKPTRGTILFDDQPVNDVEPKDRNIGMVFQSYALYPHMTVLENITFPLKQMKVPKEERIRLAKEAAEMVHLGGLLDRKPSQLSGGQQQRVALARAIVKKPQVLLLDEPLSNLDARLKIEMREEIRRLQKELGITTVMVTHDQEEAMTMADRVAVMKDGQVIQYSTPMDLYTNPTNYFVAQFIGTPPMNFLEGIEAANLRIPQQNRDMYIGIRPHDLKLGNQGDLSFDAVVNLIEPLGHSTLVSAKAGNTLLRFMVEPNQKVMVGERIQLSASLDAIHLFDKTTGQSLKDKKGELHAI